MLEVASKAEEDKEVEEAKVEVEMSEDTMKILIHKRMCSALGIHVFDYGKKASAD